MYEKHQNVAQGDMSFIESLLPKDVIAHHFDSYNIDGKRRFQGAFSYNFGSFGVTCNEVPLAVLKASRGYNLHICNCHGYSPHITWTIWFD